MDARLVVWLDQVTFDAGIVRPRAAKMVRHRSNGYVITVAHKPEMAPDVKLIAPDIFTSLLCSLVINESYCWCRYSDVYPYSQNWVTEYPIHRYDAATFPRNRERMPPSFSAMECKCWNMCHSAAAPTRLVLTLLVTLDEGCSNWSRILSRSNGAVNARAPTPAAAPAIKSCQWG